jgi:hypothetical protein
LDQSSNNITVNSRTKKLYGLIGYITSASVVWLVLITQNTFNSSANTIESTVALLVLLILFLVFDVWMVFGVESVEVTQLEIIEIKRIGFLKFTRRFELKRITEVKSNYRDPKGFIEKSLRNQGAVLKAIFFWHRMGTIRFEYNAKVKTVLSGLDKKQIKNVLLLINEANRRL